MSQNGSGRVHIYCRVSTSGQEDNTSLDTQETACRTWAQERGLAVASVAREVWSGGDRHRPDLDAMLDRLLPGDVLLAYDLDRLSRGGQIATAVLIDRIESAGASVAFVAIDFEQSETGALLRNVRAFSAAWEREKIADRTQSGKRARVASGKPLVGRSAPYGYRWADAETSKLVLDAETAPTVRRIFDLMLAGTSLRGICTALERDAIPSPGGKTRWTAPGVRHILTRPTYSGAAVAYRHRHERRPDGGYAVRPASEAEMITVPGIAEPIVSPEEQATVRNRLAVNQAQSTRNNRMPERSLLRCGVARCGYCGRSLGVKNPTPYRPDGPPRYYCKFPDCLRPTITTTMIDDAVWARVSEVLLHPEIITSEVAKHRQDGGLERDLATVETRLAGIAAKQTKTARAIARVDDDAAEPLYVELHTLSEQKKAAERERDDLHRRIADHAEEDQRVRHLEDWCQTVSENLDGLTYDERRMALDALGVRVAIYRPGAVDSTGQALPRWVMTIDPGAVLEPSLLSHSTRRTRATSFWAAASWP